MAGIFDTAIFDSGIFDEAASSLTVAVPAAVLTLTAPAPKLPALTIDVPAGVLTLSSSVAQHFTAEVPAAHLTLSSVPSARTITAVPAGALTLTGPAPTAHASQVKAIPAAVITLSASSPVLGFIYTPPPVTEAGEDSGLTPTPGDGTSGIFIDGGYVSQYLDEHQAASIRFEMEALDGNVGVGTITLPGRRSEWGAKILVYQGFDLIFWGYLGDYTHRRNPNNPKEIETTYQVWDVNRQWLGRRLDDWLRPIETDVSRFAGFMGHAMGDLTLDTTLWFDNSPEYQILDKNYTSDGVVDVGSDVILASGRTYWMGFKQDGVTLVPHYHPFTTGESAGLVITDVAADVLANPTTHFAPWNPEAPYSLSDLTLDIAVKNGIGDEALINGGGFSTGGLPFQTTLQASGDAAALTKYAVTIYASSNWPKPTYKCSIGPLNGAQVRQIPVGSLITVTCDVWTLENSTQRIAHLTLTPAVDEEGKVIVGYWMAGLELAYPLRQGAAPIYQGGALSFSGALGDNPIIYRTKTTPDHFNTPVGAADAFQTQLLDINGVEVHEKDVEIFWTLNQWQDEAKTVVGDGWSLFASSGTTDAKGVAANAIEHNTQGSASILEIVAEAIPVP